MRRNWAIKCHTCTYSVHSKFTVNHYQYIESLSFVPFPKKIDLEFEASVYISYIYMSMYQCMREALRRAKACLALHCSTHVVVNVRSSLTRTIVLDISEYLFYFLSCRKLCVFPLVHVGEALCFKHFC